MDDVCQNLKAEQRALAEDIERLFLVFDERLRALAERMHELSSEARADEVEMIREAQDALCRVLRRLDASSKSTDELEQELDAWQQREEGGPLHADHPSIRAEIIRSELVCRGTVRREQCAENGQLLPTAYCLPPNKEMLGEADTLLPAILDAAREAERWHGVPKADIDHEALDQVRHFRELHASLKRLDRKQGITRDRLAYAVSPREVY